MSNFSISHVPALSTSFDSSTTTQEQGPATETVAESSAPPSTKHIKRASEPVKPEATEKVEAKPETAKPEATETDEKKETKSADNSDDRIPDDETRRWYKKALGRAYESKQILAKKRDAAQVLAEQRAQQLQAAYAKIAELESAKQAVAEKEPATPKPIREQYDIPSEYAAAISEWSAQETKRDVTRQLREAQADTAITSAKQQIQATWTQQVQEASAKYPDFQAVALNAQLPVNEHMAHRITTSPVGTDLLYYLGQNPDVARRIASLPPLDASAELGVIAYQIQRELEAETPAPMPAIPPEPPPAPPPEKKVAPMKPISTTRGTAGRKSPENESTQEYVARRTAELYGETRAGKIIRRK